MEAAVGQLRPVLVHQAHRKFHAENAGHRVVDARHRHHALVHQLRQVGDVLLVFARHHGHIHAGIDRDSDGFLVVFIHLVDGIVVGNQKSLEAQFLLQDFGEQVLVARDFHAVPTAVGGHDGPHARLDRRDVALQVNAAQGGFIDARIALIEAPAPLRGAERGAAVAGKMFGAGQDGKRVGQVRALEAAHRRASHFLHQLRVFGETFVRAAPTYILRHRDARREHPLDAGGADFLGGDSLHSFHQRGVARASHPDVLRKDDRAQHVVVPVHRVDAVQDRDLEPRVGGVPLEPVVEIGPRLQAVAFLGVGGTAAQNGAHETGFDIRQVLDGFLIGLGHLADLLCQRHARQQWFHLGVERGKRLRLGSGGNGRAKQGGHAEAARMIHKTRISGRELTPPENPPEYAGSGQPARHGSPRRW